MTSEVVAVRADLRVSEIARLLLENHISAVPVLNEAGAPIGMVSEGDLIGRDESARKERRDWWLGLLAEGEPLSPEFISSLRRQERAASEVMSSPVVTAGEDTETGEIARLLQAHRIKRVPVLRDGRVVGIVSRENLLRALEAEVPHHGTKPKVNFLAGALAGLDQHFAHLHHEEKPLPEKPAPQRDDAQITARELRQCEADYESKKAHEREEMRQKAAEERQRSLASLIGTHVSDDSWRNIIHRAKVAAEHGEKESLLLRFPSHLCSDGSRAINTSEPDWPSTLRGEAAELYLRWDRELKPGGFHLAARVLDFPGGMPGDVGLFLVWGRR
jgi:CBS domain-containing protein